jgi:hypothetical protein
MWTAGRGGDAGGRSATSQLWVCRLGIDAIDRELAPPAAAGTGKAP